jgi:ABC transporter DrrB family efflux protein
MSDLMSTRRTAATARRVLMQLRGDRRTMALLLVVPSLLLALLHRMLNSQPSFDQFALTLLGIFPFTTMFLVTSIAMLRERTSGTLERLLTTPIGKLDLLFGYGIAFALAAAAQAVVSSMTVYWLLGLETPGSPVLVVVIAILTAVLGMSIGLMASAFATTEFQAVQFMPAFVAPQMLLSGLFVPRTQMADWLQTISDFMPMTYSVEAMDEVGSTGIVTGELLRDIGIVVATTIVALTLAAATLRRRTGAMTRRARRALVTVSLIGVTVVGVAAAADVTDAGRYVRTDNARVDGDQIAIVAPVSGTLVRWDVQLGTTVSRDQNVGRIEIPGGFVQPQQVITVPAAGDVVRNNVAEGTFVTVGTQLAIAYDLSAVFVTARVDETDIDDVRVGQFVEIAVDAYPNVRLASQVVEIGRGAATVLSGEPVDNATGHFQRVTQVIPVKIAISDRKDLPLVPGMSASVRMDRD